jgi:hypothetical protein
MAPAFVSVRVSLRELSVSELVIKPDVVPGSQRTCWLDGDAVDFDGPGNARVLGWYSDRPDGDSRTPGKQITEHPTMSASATWMATSGTCTTTRVFTDPFRRLCVRSISISIRRSLAEPLGRFGNVEEPLVCVEWTRRDRHADSTTRPGRSRRRGPCALQTVLRQPSAPLPDWVGVHAEVQIGGIVWIRHVRVRQGDGFIQGGAEARLA